MQPAPEDRTIPGRSNASAVRRRAALEEAWLGELDHWLVLEVDGSDAHRVALAALRLARLDIGGARAALAVAGARPEIAALQDLLSGLTPVSLVEGSPERCATLLATLWRLEESAEGLAAEAADELRALGAGPAGNGIVLGERLAFGGRSPLARTDLLTALVSEPAGLVLWPAIARVAARGRDGRALLPAAAELARAMPSREAQTAVSAGLALAVAADPALLSEALEAVKASEPTVLAILRAAAGAKASVRAPVLATVPAWLRQRPHVRAPELIETASLLRAIEPEHPEVVELLRRAAESAREALGPLLQVAVERGRTDVVGWALRRVASVERRIKSPLEAAAALLDGGSLPAPGPVPDLLAAGLGISRALAGGEVDRARAILGATPPAFRARPAVDRIRECIDGVAAGNAGPGTTVVRTRARRVAVRRRALPARRRAGIAAFRWRRDLARALRTAGLPVSALRALAVSSRKGRRVSGPIVARVGRVLPTEQVVHLLASLDARSRGHIGALLEARARRLVLERRDQDVFDLLGQVGPDVFRGVRPLIVALGRLGHWEELGPILVAAADHATPSRRARLLAWAGLVYERHLHHTTEASALYRQALALADFPVPSAVWVEILRAHGDARAAAESMMALAQVTRSLRDKLELYLRAAETMRDELRDGARALAAAEAARRVAPTDGRVLFMLAGLYESMGEWEKFVEVSEAHLAEDPRPDIQGMLHYRLACAYEAGLTRLDDAEFHYRRALALDPSPATHQSLRALLERMERWNDVVDALHVELSVWKTAPERASILTRIGEISDRFLDDPKAAREAYLAAIEDDPSSVPANRALLELSMRKGSLEEAYERSAFLVRTSGSRVSVGELCRLLEIRAELASRLRRAREAIASVSLAIDLQPQDASHFDAFVDILERHPTEAVDETVVERALSTQREIGSITGLARALLLAGTARMRSGDVGGAEAALMQALESDPQLVRARETLAALQSGMGRERDAEDLWTSWIADAPPGTAGPIVVGAVRWTRRWLAPLEAENAIRRWLDTMPASVELQTELAALLASRGDPQAIPMATGAARASAGGRSVRAEALKARLSLGRAASLAGLVRNLEAKKIDDPQEWLAVSAVATTVDRRKEVLDRALQYVPTGRGLEIVKRRLAAAVEELGDGARAVELLRELDPGRTELVLEATLARMRAELGSGGGRSELLETLDLVLTIDPCYVPGLRVAGNACLDLGARDMALRLLDVIGVLGALEPHEHATRAELRGLTGRAVPREGLPIAEILAPFEEDLAAESFHHVWSAVGPSLVALNALPPPEVYPAPALDPVGDLVRHLLGDTAEFAATDADELRLVGPPLAIGVPMERLDQLADVDALFLAGWAVGLCRVAGPDVALLPVARREQLLGVLEEMYCGRAVAGAPSTKELEVVSRANAEIAGRPSPRRWWSLVSGIAAQIGLMLCGDLEVSVRWLRELGVLDYEDPRLVHFAPPVQRLIRYYLSPAYLQWRRRSGAWTA